jgi:hypothetical protein
MTPMALSAAIQARLHNVGVNNAMPAWIIIDNARLLPPLPGAAAVFGDPVPQALRKLMKAFYDYGRIHWTWAQNSGPAAAFGGLVMGRTTAVACGSFNYNFKWLAENGLGIAGMGTNQDPAQFLTIPGAACIDSKWLGNVRTSTQGFDQLKCFKFSGHYWVTHGGVNYDVCYNNTFATTAEIIWTKLLAAAPNLVGKGGLGADQLFRLEKPLPAGDHLFMVQQNGANGWPSWQIATSAQIKALG